MRKQKHQIYLLLIMGTATLLVIGISWSDLEARMSITQYKSTSIPVTSEEEFRDRRARLDRVCSENHVLTKSYGQVYTDPQTSLLYCIVPKTGCTFWMLFFQSMLKNRSSVNNMKLLWDSSSKAGVHSSSVPSHQYNASHHNDTAFGVRFLVTRDPFSRIVSTFLDKAFLPDFWRTHASTVVHNKNIPERDDHDFLRQLYDQIALKYQPGFKKGVNTTYNYRRCAKYVTFNEYVTTTMHYSEQHERPIYQQCNPCSMNITHVSRMNSFTPDARGILSKTSFQNILDDWDNTNQMEEELKIILDYNFNVLGGRKDANKQMCASYDELALRLWYNFRWKGFTHPAWNYTSLDNVNATKEQVRAHLEPQLRAAMAAGLNEPELLKQTKKKVPEDMFQVAKRHGVCFVHASPQSRHTTVWF